MEIKDVLIYVNPVLSVLAFIVSIFTFRMTRRATLYSDIDARYHDLLKLGLANPDFVDPEKTRNYKESFKGRELLQYERYAFAAWNIVETIYDRRGDGKLLVTWKPIIREENSLHRAWLNHPDNQHKFKKEFLAFIIACPDFPCPACLEQRARCDRCGKLLAMAQSETETPLIRERTLLKG